MYLNFIKSSLVKSIVFSLCLLLIAFLFFTPILSSDDVGMNMTLSGSYTLQPDEHVLFTNIIYSFFLKWLYSIAVSVPWYSIMFYFVLFISFTVFFYIIFINQKEYFSLLFIFIFSSLFLLYLTIYLQFTIVSSCAATAGFFLFLHNYTINNRYYLIFILSVFLIFISIIIRFESFLLVVFLMSPIFLFHFYEKFKTKEFLFIKRKIFFLLSILVISISLNRINHYQYEKDPEWNRFLELFKARGMFTDWGIPFSKKAAAEAQWSENDYTMIREWYYDDTTVFTLNRMQAYINNSPPPYSKILSFLSHIFPSPSDKNNGNNIKKLVKKDSMITSEISSNHEEANKKNISYQSFAKGYIVKTFKEIYPMILLYVLSFLLISFNIKNVIQILIINLFILFAFAVIIVFFKLPPLRVVLSFLLFAIISLISYWNKKISLGWVLVSLKNKIYTVISVVFILFSFYFIVRLYKSSILIERDSISAKKNMQNIFLSDTNSVYVIWSYQFPVQKLFMPFDSGAPEFFRKYNLLLLGSITNCSPLNVYNKKRYKIENISLDLCKENVFLISSPEHNKLLAVYMLKNYGIEIKEKLIDGYFKIYKITCSPRNSLSISVK